MRFFLGTILATLCILAASNAYAEGCRGPATNAREIKITKLPIKLHDGSAGMATITYTVYATINACEGGNASGWDNRVCDFSSVATRLHRLAVVKPNNKDQIDLGEINIAVPNAVGTEHKGDNCNTVMINRNDWREYLDRSLSDVTHWATFIDSDFINTRTMLGLMGELQKALE